MMMWEKLTLVVADWGCGMNFDKLQECLQLGYKSQSGHPLNQHGFGIKNALTVLSGGGTWQLASRESESEPYTVVHGPFQLEMPTSDEVSLDFLPEDVQFAYPNPRTVICVGVARSFARTATRKTSSTSLPVLRNWLIEHLGVMYRGYLGLDVHTMEPKAKIIVSLESSSTMVPPVPVPMTVLFERNFTVELHGKSTKIIFRAGQIDPRQREQLIRTSDGCMKAKYYYQSNITTQGTDIMLGGRVIATSMFSEIWMSGDGEPLVRHNSFNDFTGELIVPEVPAGALPTINNKSGIDLNNEDWTTVFSLLQDFKPDPKEKANTEKRLCHNWMDILKAARPEDTITDEFSIWPTATRIDVVDMGPQKVDIYEVKVGKAEPLNLYQLKMYWDGMVLAGKQPTGGTLLVKDYCADLVEMCKQMNQMPPPLLPDAQSAPYKFSICTHTEKKLADI